MRRAAVVLAVMATAGSVPVAQATDLASVVTASEEATTSEFPPAPAPEPIEISRLPLPPTTNADGVCEHPTGCLADDASGHQAGGFLPDGKTVSLRADYAGAPAAPDPASVYSGSQIVLVKADGSTFANGEPWKCITCGVPDEQKVGMTDELSYPQPFPDGRRILAGPHVVECSKPLASDACTPERTHVYPIRWNVTPDGSGPGGAMRELRLNPDGVHLAWSKLVLGPFEEPDPTNPLKTVELDQYAYFGRLRFNPNPAAGAPDTPRYELEHVTVLNSPDFNSLFIHQDTDDATKLTYRRKGAVGELRGFTGDGQGILGMCWAESNNTDICATDLTTGESRRLTADPSYIDPVDVSPDDNWTVALETRHNDRFWYIAGLPGVPPINQILDSSAGAAASGYRNGEHRLFQPWLLDRYPERPGYDGQRINACQPGGDPSICDENWGTQADPRWSPDGTKIVYGQRLAHAPDCEGFASLECSETTEPGGHTYRLMLAELTSRDPQPAGRIAPVSDEVPWGTPYAPGDPDPVRSHVPTGTYTLDGQHSGSATVVVTETPDQSAVLSVSAVYDNYSDDGRNFLDGTETVHNEALVTTFHSDLVLSGDHTGARVTSPGGFTVSVVNAFTGEIVYAGTMTTILDGQTYHPPLPTM